MTMIPLICVVGAMLLAETPADSPLRRFDETQAHMGTKFTIQVYAASEATARPALAAAFAKIAALDKSLSDYNPESELNLLSAASPHAQPVPVSHDLWVILSLARRVSRGSDGAFDVSVGPITRLWRQARRQKKLPDTDKLQAALAAVDYQAIDVSYPQKQRKPNSETVRLTKPNMRLDLGGIAQGYAAEAALRVLKEHGFSRALINASGDIVAADPPPGERGWKVGLTGVDPQAPPQLVWLANGSLSTSGDAYQFTEVAGKRYSHIVDPKTGLGLTTRMSVTIYHPNGTIADAFASAVCVLGPTKGLAMVEKEPNCAALFILATDEGVRTIKSARFAELVIPVEP